MEHDNLDGARRQRLPEAGREKGTIPQWAREDAGLVGLRRKQAETLEPKERLDTSNGMAGATAAAPVPADGPEDDFSEWDRVDWGQAEENVRRLFLLN